MNLILGLVLNFGAHQTSTLFQVYDCKKYFCEKISNQQIKIHAIKMLDKTKLRKNVVHDLRDNKTSCRLDTIVYPCKNYF